MTSHGNHLAEEPLVEDAIRYSGRNHLDKLGAGKLNWGIMPLHLGFSHNRGASTQGHNKEGEIGEEAVVVTLWLSRRRCSFQEIIMRGSITSLGIAI